ncbi:MAG: homoserine dehydrogenase [Betaproteobacteria bacterium]|nr:homoserine dehydrogenase [Betaproteobacteria bacterium]NDF03939.1 homoserine dehydrogenase [Betaproteobacteria bacterium]
MSEASTQRPLRVGLVGLGTVGAGTYELLLRNRNEIARRASRPIEVVAVSDKDLGRVAELTKGLTPVEPDAMALATRNDIDVVVELIGGDGFAKTLMLAAIDAGRHIVTANKALLAKHANEIFGHAHSRGTFIGFEAAVAGGIPIIKALREGLAANRIQSVTGIINGTTNFILTEMREKGLAFSEVLAEAQRLGYAEADPTFDVEGVDAAHKISLLSAIAFGTAVHFDQAHIEGITKLSSRDISYAEQMGYRIKLLGITKRKPGGIELRVHPTLVPEDVLMASVEGAMNAVHVLGDAVGHTLYYGKGAGAMPTASAVVADLIDLARLLEAAPEARVPYLGVAASAKQDLPVLPIAEIESGFYLRLGVKDEPGVLADITRRVADSGISIDAFIQHPGGGGEGQTEVILITHPCIERQIRLAVAQLSALPSVVSDCTVLRVESFQ